MTGSEHVVVVDLGFGDAGKGTVVDWLCASRPVHTVVRFNGGAQAGHNVVLADRRQHTFAQFGSGTFRGTRTHLSRFMVVDPLALAAEAAHLADLGVTDPLRLVTVEAAALLATPYHVAANRARETARGAGRHGSCGMGVGEVMGYAARHPGAAPTVADCTAPAVLRDKLAALRDRLAGEVGRPFGPPVQDCVAAFVAFAERVSIVDAGHLAEILSRELVVFEGAQGVLLDEWHGFHPHTTWSTTTFANAELLLAEAGSAVAGPAGQRRRIPAVRLGVVRTTTTRHGPGPLVTEDPGLSADLPDRHNPPNRWQGRFRVGQFDAVALRYAVAAAGGVDAVALTHLDVAGSYPNLRFCSSYADRSELPADPSPAPIDPLGPAALARLARQERLGSELASARPVLGPAPVDWPEAVGQALGAPVAVTSSGPTAGAKWSDPAFGWASRLASCR